MTDKVNPSRNRPGKAKETGLAIALAGGADPGWIVPAGTVYLADEDPGLNEAALNEFSNAGTAGFDLTVDAGEAFVMGSWLARDAQTTVTLAASTANQTVFLGYDRDNGDTVIIGTASAFNTYDPKMEIFEVDTDGAGITNVTDLRNVDDYRIPATSIEPGVGLSTSFGDGSDGAITRTANGNENGVINATTYAIGPGVTRTVTSGVLVVHATEEILIEGTISSSASGASGGGGAVANAGNGSAGSNADILAQSGSGGTGDTGAGDPGTAGGGGAGGGGGGAACDNPATGSSGFANGGDGGRGGGVIVLAAPKITITGTVSATGGSGNDGQDGFDGSSGGGGGGGGQGGAIILVSPAVSDDSATFDVSGGSGGLGGARDTNDAAGTSHPGGDGGDGDVGEILRIGN